MAAHALLVALLALSPAAPPDRPSVERSPHELRTAVREAMRRQATTSGAAKEAATRELVALYGELAASTTLSDAEKRSQLGNVRNRLRRTSDALAQQLKKVEAAAPSEPTARAARPQQPAAQALLAQLPGNAPRQQAGAAGGRRQNFAAAGPAGGGAAAGPGQALAAATNENAEQLIDLIQTTIAPHTWDVNGGHGAIRYFAPAQVLVIRQTGGVHGEVSDALGLLRKN
jgi:hypothetical protein